MRVTHYEPAGSDTRERWDTNTVARFDEVESLSELLTAVESLREKYAPARLLCTLDNVNQCMYTSMHASYSGLLDHDEPEYGDDLAAAHSADNARIAHIAALLDAPDSRIAWGALGGTRGASRTDLEALVEINREPDRAVDDVVIVQRVPVPRDDLAIAGIPNGYFIDDWNTFQNQAVIRRMAAHGYRHIATGAALLGFDRPSPPTETEAGAVVEDLAFLYGEPDSALWPQLAKVLCGQRILLIGYAEDFADVLE
ncbi:hypothetical protein ACFVUS_24200 [Nocardia sp. NPDC058058]|uniref:hypothetical protein n=1 Tax=Nocardia sp. NPDC058058 TaxID=3346317 RepID=UPI0036D9B9B9